MAKEPTTPERPNPPPSQAPAPAPAPAASPAPAPAPAPGAPGSDKQAQEQVKQLSEAVPNPRKEETTLPLPADDEIEKRELDMKNVQTGGEGQPSDEPKSTQPMPTGGPRDPAIAAGREKERFITADQIGQVAPPIGMEGRDVRLVPTGVTEVLGPRKLKYVEGATVKVLQRSYIKDVLREPGDIVSNYTGHLSGNLVEAD